MTTHITKTGKRIKLRDMTDSHLAATIKMLERRAKEGVIISVGGGGDGDDMFYDEYTIYGIEALDQLGYDDYTNELKRRAARKHKQEN